MLEGIPSDFFVDSASNGDAERTREASPLCWFCKGSLNGATPSAKNACVNSLLLALPVADTSFKAAFLVCHSLQDQLVFFGEDFDLGMGVRGPIWSFDLQLKRFLTSLFGSERPQKNLPVPSPLATQNDSEKKRSRQQEEQFVCSSDLSVCKKEVVVTRHPIQTTCPRLRRSLAHHLPRHQVR